MAERPRAIVHVDLDAFYAAVEILEHGELKGKQLLIGGRPESRGVVSTASYEARAKGVHSAMPMAEAVRLLGVGGSRLSPRAGQLGLFGGETGQGP